MRYVTEVHIFKKAHVKKNKIISVLGSLLGALALEVTLLLLFWGLER